MTYHDSSLCQKPSHRSVIDESSSWFLFQFPDILLLCHQRSEFRDLAHMVFTFERRHTAASLLPSQLVKNHANRVDVVTKLIRVLTHFLYGKHRLQRAKIALLKGIDKSMRKFITGISLVAAPFGQIGAGIVLAVQGSSQGWILAHVLMLEIGRAHV